YPIKTFTCPSDPHLIGRLGEGMGGTENGPASMWAFGNYAANYYVFGNPGKPTVQGAGTIPGSFPDGTSNVIPYTQRYGTCGSSGNPDARSTSSNLWGDSTGLWRPVFCINNLAQMPIRPGFPPCNMFQVQPDWIRGCDSSRAQTPHPGGIQVCLGDGSVRF